MSALHSLLFIQIKLYLSRQISMLSNPTQPTQQPISKFLIMHPFHPDYEINRPQKKKIYREAMQTSKKIHNLLIQRNWTVYGQNSFDSHLINKRSGQIRKQMILVKLKQMFESNTYEYLAIFLMAHGKRYQNFYNDHEHEIQIEISKTKSEYIELRQIINLWRPFKFKHLFIGLYACESSKIDKIMQYYENSSSISIISSYDQKQQCNLFPDGNTTITSHLFGLNMDDPGLKNIVVINEKIIGGGFHEHWVAVLSQSYTSWLQNMGPKIRSLNYENSRYFGEVKECWERSGYLKHGKGFMQSVNYYFEGKFRSSKFAIGRLYYKNPRKTYYGTKFQQYNLKGRGCIIYEDKQTLKNDGITIGHYPFHKFSKYFRIIEKFTAWKNQKFVHFILKNEHYEFKFTGETDNAFQDCILTAKGKRISTDNQKSSVQYQNLKKTLKQNRTPKTQTITQIFFQKISTGRTIKKPTLKIRSKYQGKIYQLQDYSQLLAKNHLHHIFDRYLTSKDMDDTQPVTRWFYLRVQAMEVTLEGNKQYFFMVEFENDQW